jgi:hypothetical protein
MKVMAGKGVEVGGMNKTSFCIKKNEDGSGALESSLTGGTLRLCHLNGPPAMRS